MMSRRDFLRNSAVAVGAGWPKSLEANPYGKPVGLQLYTVRDQLTQDLPGTLKKVAAIGYKEVEVYDFYGRSAAEFHHLLTDLGLTAPSAHYTTANIKSGWEKHIEFARQLGIKYMVNAILQPSERRSFDDYRKLVELFTHAAEQTRKAGIQFCYHDHNFEFKKYGDTTAYDFLLKELDPKLVKFEMDCFWVTHAGQDPVAYFKKYPGRFPLLHIKDLKPGNPPTQEMDARQGLFTEVGHGTIDWRRIFSAATAGGMQHYYVEQDFCEVPPLESIKISYDYLHQLTV